MFDITPLLSQPPQYSNNSFSDDDKSSVEDAAAVIFGEPAASPSFWNASAPLNLTEESSIKGRDEKMDLMIFEAMEEFCYEGDTEPLPTASLSQDENTTRMCDAKRNCCVIEKDDRTSPGIIDEKKAIDILGDDYMHGLFSNNQTEKKADLFGEIKASETLPKDEILPAPPDDQHFHDQNSSKDFGKKAADVFKELDRLKREFEPPTKMLRKEELVCGVKSAKTNQVKVDAFQAKDLTQITITPPSQNLLSGITKSNTNVLESEEQLNDESSLQKTIPFENSDECFSEELPIMSNSVPKFPFRYKKGKGSELKPNTLKEIGNNTKMEISLGNEIVDSEDNDHIESDDDKKIKDSILTRNESSTSKSCALDVLFLNGEGKLTNPAATVPAPETEKKEVAHTEDSAMCENKETLSCNKIGGESDLIPVEDSADLASAHSNSQTEKTSHRRVIKTTDMCHPDAEYGTENASIGDSVKDFTSVEISDKSVVLGNGKSEFGDCIYETKDRTVSGINSKEDSKKIACQEHLQESLETNTSKQRKNQQDNFESKASFTEAERTKNVQVVSDGKNISGNEREMVRPGKERHSEEDIPNPVELIHSVEQEKILENNCLTNLQISPIVALESTNGIEKEKHVKDCCSHPQEKTFGSLKSNFGTKEHREIILDKPGMPTKSNNQEEGKEKDDKEIFCHPQEDVPVEEVKNSHIVNKTTDVDSKSEVIDSNFGIKEQREILIDKPGMPTKSNNLEKGKEKDGKETFCHPQEDIPIEEVKDSHIVNKTTNADSKNEVIDGTTTALKPSSNKSEWISSRPQKISPRLQICEPEKNELKMKSDANCETNLQTSPIVALESTNSIEKERKVKNECSHPQEKSHKSDFGIREQREVLIEKPGMPTKSNNLEKGKEKDGKETFCHPQEDIPIEEVNDCHIVNKTTDADDKNEVIDGTTPALKPRSNKSEWISSRPQKISPRLQICEPEKNELKMKSNENKHIANKKQRFLLEQHSEECNDSLCDTQDDTIVEATRTMSRLRKGSVPRNHLKTPSWKDTKKSWNSFTSPSIQVRPSKSKVDEKYKQRCMYTLDGDECASQVENTPCSVQQAEVTPPTVRRTPPHHKAKPSPGELKSLEKTMEDENTRHFENLIKLFELKVEETEQLLQKKDEEIEQLKMENEHHLKMIDNLKAKTLILEKTQDLVKGISNVNIGMFSKNKDSAKQSKSASPAVERKKSATDIEDSQTCVSVSDNSLQQCTDDVDLDADYKYGESEESESNSEDCVTFSNDQEDGPSQSETEISNNEDDHLLVRGSDGLLTASSMKKCSALVREFFLSNDVSSFFPKLWQPIWEVINSQGNEQTCWKHVRYAGPGRSLNPTYCFVPPNTSMNAKRSVEGRDHFFKREMVVKCIMEKSIHSNTKKSARFQIIKARADLFFRNLEPAEETRVSARSKRRRSSIIVEEDNYETKIQKPKQTKVKNPKKQKRSENLLDKNENVKHATSDDLSDTLENSNSITLSALKKKRNKKRLSKSPDCGSVSNSSIGNTTKKRKTIKSPKTKLNGKELVAKCSTPVQDDKYRSILSRKNSSFLASSKQSGSIARNVSIAIDREGNDEDDTIWNKEEKKESVDYATKNGIKLLLQKRQAAWERKEYKSFFSNEKKIIPPQCNHHLTQSPSKEARENIFPLHTTLDQSKGAKPLSGCFFFMSGCADSVKATTKKLGGLILETEEQVYDKRMDCMGKLFFLSQPSARRRHKYILATALGVPMLHYSWIDEIKSRCNNLGHEYGPDPFNSILYEQKRLPIGLSMATGVFALQKTKYAAKWLQPGCEGDGSPILSGMTLVVTLESEEAEKSWVYILNVLGATVLNASSLKNESLIPDAILVDAVTLPPHATAMPPRVASVLNSMENVPVIELSWVVQSIVNRKRLDFDSHSCFIVNYNGKLHNKLFSLKTKRGKDHVRYEVGDTVQISEGSSTHFCRIMMIEPPVKKCHFLKVKVLVQNGDFQLFEDTKSAALITISEKQLRSHIVLLCKKDFICVKTGYIPDDEDKSDIFLHRKHAAKPSAT